MSKVRYNKQTKSYEREIKINGVTATVSFPTRPYLESLPYRLVSEIVQDTNPRGEE